MSSIQWLMRAYNFALTQDPPWEIPYSQIQDLQNLGWGSQGTVYTATLNSLKIAVKRVNDSNLADIKHLAKLKHPNVIKFKGISQHSANVYILMEYCPFGSLYDLVRTGRQIPPERVADWTQQIASGMHYLHQHNIIHHDLKSPNILLSNHDTLKISDFGSHKLTTNNLTSSMSNTGTISWMAPEVILNRPSTFKVDVWSYGVVVWELLTCEIPFKNLSTPTIILGLGTGSIRLTIPSTFPDGYKKLLDWCWRLRPANRPTFEQILVELKEVSDELKDIANGLFRQMQISWKHEIDLGVDAMSCLTRRDESLQRINDKSKTQKYQSDSPDAPRIDYEHKLREILDLYMELQACWLQVGRREEELTRKENALKKREAALEARTKQITLSNGDICHSNSCVT